VVVEYPKQPLAPFLLGGRARALCLPPRFHQFRNVSGPLSQFLFSDSMETAEHSPEPSHLSRLLCSFSPPSFPAKPLFPNALVSSPPEVFAASPRSFVLITLMLFNCPRSLCHFEATLPIPDDLDLPIEIPSRRSPNLLVSSVFFEVSVLTSFVLTA